MVQLGNFEIISSPAQDYKYSHICIQNSIKHLRWSVLRKYLKTLDQAQTFLKIFTSKISHLLYSKSKMFWYFRETNYIT